MVGEVKRLTETSSATSHLNSTYYKMVGKSDQILHFGSICRAIYSVRPKLFRSTIALPYSNTVFDHVTLYPYACTYTVRVTVM